MLISCHRFRILLNLVDYLRLMFVKYRTEKCSNERNVGQKVK